MSSFFFGNARCAVAGFFRALATTSKRMKKISAHAEEMMEALKDFDEKMEKEVRDLSKEEGWTLVDAYIERASTSALKSALEVCNRRRAGRTPGCVAGNSWWTRPLFGQTTGMLQRLPEVRAIVVESVKMCGRETISKPSAKIVENWISYNVGKTIKYNHPPVITMFIGGMFTIPRHGWFMTCFFPTLYNIHYNLLLLVKPLFFVGKYHNHQLMEVIIPWIWYNHMYIYIYIYTVL